MQKKLCILLPGWITKRIGGSEWQSYLIAEELIRRGWKLEVVTLKDLIMKPTYLNPHITYISYKNYKSCFITFLVIFFKLLNTESRYYYIRTDARILRGACRLYTWIFKKRMLFAIGSDNDASNISLLKNLKFNFLYFLKFFDRCFTEVFVRWGINADVIIAQTERQRRIFEKTGKKNTVVISNSYKISLSNVNFKENIILWVGNIRNLDKVDNVKQPDYFVKLADIFAHFNWKFIMIGRGTKELNCESQNLSLLGELNKADVEKWFKRSKIFINTSKIEGYPNTFLEAIFNHCVIISLLTDIDDLLKDHKLGFICDNDFTKLAGNLKMIMDNYETTDIRNMINCAYSFFLERVSIENNVDKLISTIELL